MVGGNRSLPALPFNAGLAWYEDEDVHDPWLRIEVQVYAHLVSRDLLDSAMEQAWRTITHSMEYSPCAAAGTGGKHPLSFLIPRAKSNRSETKRRALERWQRGEVDFEGLLVEEWQGTGIQQEQLDAVVQLGGNPVQLQKRHRDLQKRVYDRVRKWFPDPKPRVAIKARWRQHMPLPDSNEPLPTSFPITGAK